MYATYSMLSWVFLITRKQTLKAGDKATHNASLTKTIRLTNFHTRGNFRDEYQSDMMDS